MATYSLDKYNFVTLHRPEDRSAPPLIVQQQGEVIERVGVDGAGFLRTGRRGKPFQMRSAVDYATRALADQAQDGYGGMVGQSRYTLVWAGVDYSAEHNCQYIVIDVDVFRVQYMPVAVGGLSGANAVYWLEALWTLLPVPSA